MIISNKNIMIKNTFYSLVMLLFFVISCKSQSQKDAAKTASDIQSMVKANSPGTRATTADGFMMTAKINGKEWKANAMYPPDRAGQVNGENNGESISLPYYDRRSFLANTRKKLGDGGSTAELRLNDDIVLYTGVKGTMEITKSDDNMAEGKFSFTAKGFQSDKTVEVTDGFFRIMFK